jgi:ATP diphosphatase
MMKKSENIFSENHHILADISPDMVALKRALKLQEKAAEVGFDWNNPLAVIEKLREELDELEAEVLQKNKNEQEEELGDLLFCVVNLARHLKIDCDQALHKTNIKFEQRFAYIEDELAKQSIPFAKATLEQMEQLWGEAKRVLASKASKTQ